MAATLETRCFQDIIFDDFGFNLGPPIWDQFGVILGIIFVDVFLDWLFDGLGLHLGSQNTSEMRYKRVPTPTTEIL